MSQWSGAARSNYVRIADMPGLIKSLEPFMPSIEISPNAAPDESTVCFLADAGGEGWPTWGQDEDENEIEFNAAEHICPFMEPNQVLVLMESGAEKLCYVSGHASAYHSDGREVHLSLTDIYKMAADAFDLSVLDITACEY